MDGLLTVLLCCIAGGMLGQLKPAWDAINRGSANSRLVESLVGSVWGMVIGCVVGAVIAAAVQAVRKKQESATT